MIRLLSCGDPIFSVPSRARTPPPPSPTTTTATVMPQGGKVYSYTKHFVRPFRPQFALKIRGAGPLGPSPESASEKDKKAEKPQKNGKEFESVGLKNWLSKEKKTSKNRENIKQYREARNICRKRKVSSQEGWNLRGFDSIAKLPHLYN